MHRAFISPLFALLVTVMSGPFCASTVAEEGRGSPIHLTVGTLGHAAGLDQFPLPSSTFRLNDRVYFFTQVTWDPGRGAPGVHHLLYKWFTPGAPLFSFGGDKEFKSAPMSWSAYMVGTHVGLGHHRAEVWIDDQLLDGDTDTFDRETALLRSSGERTPAGAWKIYYFYHSLDDFSRADPTNPRWATLESTTARWLAATPDSPAAAIMAANVLLKHGWAYRGDGFADSVCARLMSRLVLRSDSLELVGPGGRRHLGRGEISTWGYRSPSAGPGAGFRITSQTGIVLEIPPLLGADESLVQWFEQLPSGRAPA